MLHEQSSRRAFRTLVSRQFLGALLATPEGRAYVLTQAAIAEETDEGAIFRELEKRVEDHDLQRMVKRHAADETRHAQVFFEAADRQGVGRPEIPANIRVLELLNARLGLFKRPLEGASDVMDAYLILQVIEERAVEQFEIIGPVFRKYDAQAADSLAAIAVDEARHLLYCRAISKRYAPSEAAREARLAEFREAEALAFKEHQESGLTHLLASGFLSPGKAWFWRNTIALLSKRNDLPYTQFYGTTGGQIAEAA